MRASSSQLRQRGYLQDKTDMNAKTVRARLTSWRAIAAVVLMAAGTATISPVLAQSWWPFGNDEPRRPPVPREPVYRDNPVPAPPPIEQGRGAPPPAATWSGKNPICLQLEQRLVQDGQRGSQSRDMLPQIEAQIRENERIYQQSQQQLDRSCYEYFLFAKTFRNTPSCKNLVVQSDNARRRLSDLESQKQQLASQSNRSYRDEIISELARNNCGANYTEQARRRQDRDYGFWQDDEGVTGPNTWTPYGNNGVATYRTLCVRLCDGYYFPVSFSTLPSHFEQDAGVCQQKCAAPSELYYYQNPGGSVDQSISAASQQPYTTLKSAFRYRKEFVKGCSCKPAEYVAEAGGTAGGGNQPQGAGGPSIGDSWAPQPQPQ